MVVVVVVLLLVLLSSKHPHQQRDGNCRVDFSGVGVDAVVVVILLLLLLLSLFLLSQETGVTLYTFVCMFVLLLSLLTARSEAKQNNSVAMSGNDRADIAATKVPPPQPPPPHPPPLYAL